MSPRALGPADLPLVCLLASPRPRWMRRSLAGKEPLQERTSSIWVKSEPGLAFMCGSFAGLPGPEWNGDDVHGRAYVAARAEPVHLLLQQAALALPGYVVEFSVCGVEPADSLTIGCVQLCASPASCSRSVSKSSSLAYSMMTLPRPWWSSIWTFRPRAR